MSAFDPKRTFRNDCCPGEIAALGANKKGVTQFQEFLAFFFVLVSVGEERMFETVIHDEGLGTHFSDPLSDELTHSVQKPPRHGEADIVGVSVKKHVAEQQFSIDAELWPDHLSQLQFQR